MNVRPWSEAEPADNAVRFAAGRRGHVESYFLRANDPTRPRALWLKATILAPLEGAPVAEIWFVWFDGESGTTFGHRDTVPLSQAAFDEIGGGIGIRAGESKLRIGPSGSARGRMERAGRRVSWDLAWTSGPSAVSERLSIFPWKLLRTGPFPKSKLLTPFPSLHFSGEVQVGQERVSLEGWTGMQGHNWGKEHAFEYAWGQCLFPATGSEPEAMVEGFTGRVKALGRTTPRMSALVVREGARTYRFDRLLDYWTQRATLSARAWTVRLESDDGVASLTMDAGDMPLACLGYRNPDGHLSYCMNTKLARVWLHVQPKSGPAFARESLHGGALEFLRHEPDPAIPEVI